VKALYIAAASVRRMLRERSNIFFVFLLPMLLILVLGAAFGGTQDPRVGVVSGEAGELGVQLEEGIAASEGLDARSYADREELILAVERGQLEAGVAIPAGYDQALQAGRTVAVEFVSRPEQTAQALRNTVEAAVSRQAAVLRAAAFASGKREAAFIDAHRLAVEVALETPGLQIRQQSLGEPFSLDRLGQFDLGAYSGVLLFVFLTSTAGSAALIQSRRLGVSRRMLSTPTSVSTILAGEALGRFGVALVQGLFIMIGSALFFGVDWGDPVAALVILALFALGAAAVGMLMGAVFKNDQQAGGIGVVAGLGLAALGGCMLPLTIMKQFSPGLWRVAHITPHAWGIKAFEEIIIRDGSLLDIGLELGVLAGFSLVVFTLATWRLRVALTRQ
jgi:ABC-2 type transport system permease protein